MLSFTSNKRKLLRGACALILGSISVAAAAQTVRTTTSSVTPPSVDTLVLKTQENEGTATVYNNGQDYEAISSVPVTNSSVSLDNNGSLATAKGNDGTATLTAAAAAEIYTTNAISLNQDNSRAIAAQANGTDTYAYGNDVSGSTIDVYNNINIASGQGNSGTTSTTLTGYATNSTEAVIAALQNNDGTSVGGNDSVTVRANDNDVILKLETEVDGSTGAVTGNTDRSSATGNSLTQQMSLGGTSLVLSSVSATADTTPTAGGAGTADVNATGAAIISSSQINDNADVDAQTVGSYIEIQASVNIDGSVLDLSSNVQDATATGSAVGNTMTLNGTTVGTGAAIVSSQLKDADSVTVAFTNAAARIYTGTVGDDTGSTITLTDNKIQSVATGGSVSNAMAVTANTVTLQAQDTTKAVDIGRSGLTSDTSLSGAVSGAFVTLNDQLIERSVLATTRGSDGTGAGFLVYSGGNVTDSTITNNRNTLSAQVQAALATNSTTLTVAGSLTEADNVTSAATVANGAAIANIQEVTDGATLVEAVVDAPSAVKIGLDDGLYSSTLTASANKVQASAEGATSTNVLTVTAGTINVADASTGNASTTAGVNDADANTAFAVANRQDSGTANVKAILYDSEMIETAIDVAVDASSVTSASNVLDAVASSNKATNTLSLSATTLSGDAGLVNNQSSETDALAWIGGYGVGDAFVAGASGANAGAIVTVGDDITDSTIAVSGNMISGSAISNSGNNSLTVAATSLFGDGQVGQAIAAITMSTDSTSLNTVTTADYGLGSYQETLSGGSSQTYIASTFGIEQGFDKDLSGSSLSVSNNTQLGEALANTVTNRVTMTATDMGGSGLDAVTALNNNQYVDSATIDSNSTMTVLANAASDTSSIALNGNSNTALGIANNASSVMVVTGVTIGGSSLNDAEATLSLVTADYAINNTQKSLGNNGLTGASLANDGVVNSIATTTISNWDITDVYGAASAKTATAGLLNSSVTMSNNLTTAEASSNLGLSSLSVSATDIFATAALGNIQDSNNAVNAVATNTSIKMELDVMGATGAGASSDYAASGSTVTMANNITSALARGNSASNTLNYTAGASYSGYIGDAVSIGSSAQAGAVVMNSQDNGGAINSTASSVSYRIALQDGANGLAYGSLNSSISMTGNAVNAVAFGNKATNALTMSTLGAGIPSAVNANIQVMGGSVTATVTNANFNIISAANIQGSAIRSIGNTVNAEAIGNSSVSTIGGGN